ncbi:MAG: copper resistance CopC family protein [Candidatus Promineifilaceae bacterium]
MNWHMFCRNRWPTFVLLSLVLWGIARPQRLYAHIELRQTFPAPGQVFAASPREIRLTFSEPPLSAYVQVYGRQFEEIPGVEVLPLMPNAVNVIATVPPLMSGAYTVQWLTLSADNHTVTGTFQFEVQSAPPSPVINTVVAAVLAAAVLTGIGIFIRSWSAAARIPPSNVVG